MIYFCSCCKTNWAQLWKSEGEGDEVYEVCPVCRTDFFLEEGNDIVAYCKSPITGVVFNAATGLPDPATVAKPKIRVVVGKPKEKTWQEKKDEWADKELAAIRAYQASGNEADYFAILKSK